MKKQVSKKPNIKKLVKKTFERYNVSIINARTVKDIIDSRGYRVIRYNPTDLSESTRRLLQILNLLDYACFNDSFTYSDSLRKIVFIRQDISDDDYLYLLIFELGRILTYTEKTDNLIGITAVEKAYASEFAYHVTDCEKHSLIYNFFKFNPVISSIGITLAFSFLIGVFIIIHPKLLSQNDEIFADAPNVLDVKSIAQDILEIADNVNSDVIENNNIISESDTTNFVIPQDKRVYYATKSGKKYHIAGCSYILGKDTIELSMTDIENGNYTPCSRCFE